MNTPDSPSPSRRTLSVRTATLLLFLSLLVALAAPPPSRAEVNASLPTVAQRDKNFAKEAARGLMRDTRIAALAEKRAAKKQIRSFMYHVLQRRLRADGTLRRLVRKTGLRLPMRLDAQQRQEIARLEKLQGAEFDKAALRMISEADYVRFFEFVVNGTSPEADRQVKAFAQQQLPILRKDMKSAKRWLEGYDRI